VRESFPLEQFDPRPDARWATAGRFVATGT